MKYLEFKLCKQSLFLTEQELLSSLSHELHALAITRGKAILRSRQYKERMQMKSSGLERGDMFEYLSKCGIRRGGWTEYEKGKKAIKQLDDIDENFEEYIGWLSEYVGV